MRINELMQARVSKDCLVRQVDDPPPGAKDRSARIRYLFRLIPKGEKTDTPRNYFIGKAHELRNEMRNQKAEP